MRTFIAFLCAPLVVSVGWLTSMLFASAWSSSSHMPLSERLLELLVTGVAIYIGAVWFTLIIALPLFFLFRRFDLVRSWTSGLTGILVGGLAGVFLGKATAPLGIFGLSMLGGLAGLVFWRVSRFGAEQESE